MLIIRRCAHRCSCMEFWCHGDAFELPSYYCDSPEILFVLWLAHVSNTRRLSAIAARKRARRNYIYSISFSDRITQSSGLSSSSWNGFLIVAVCWPSCLSLAQLQLYSCSRGKEMSGEAKQTKVKWRWNNIKIVIGARSTRTSENVVCEREWENEDEIIKCQLLDEDGELDQVTLLYPQINLFIEWNFLSNGTRCDAISSCSFFSFCRRCALCSPPWNLHYYA